MKFLSGNGFEIDDLFYLYNKGNKIHIHGNYNNILRTHNARYIHIFINEYCPYIIYFTHWIDGDAINKNNQPFAYKLATIDNHFSMSAGKLFNYINIPPGKPKKQNRKYSGYNVIYEICSFQNRICAKINLKELCRFQTNNDLIKG